MIIVAVDPGLLSGFAAVRIWDDHLDLIEADELDWQHTCRRVASYLQLANEPVQIVVEAFVITPETAKKSPQPWAIEITGMLKLLAFQYKGEDVIKLKMSESKTFAPNPRLKALGVDPGAKKGHARDAARLAVLYAVRQGFNVPALLL